MQDFLSELETLCKNHGKRLSFDQVEEILLQMIGEVRRARAAQLEIDKDVDDAAKNQIT
ncbi:hypothetical protein H6F67_14100 [Microcoleus sp. FACHB-1515]|uniref:hypothetical protein n=1 Tax=Cyanophyceae TaxID=3028117 RepID=UPI001688F5F7|nr:hypothetical protein [Microcoleus sp. FACHB-1515]MBD2090984.1 hypothetical protein [Microcoleus sp. FACHB-1515]